MSKQEDDFYVEGELSAAWESVLVFPTNPKPGRTVFYRPEAQLYWWSGNRWVEASSIGSGASSFYSVPANKTISIADGAVLNLMGNLSLDGMIILDGMIADSS